MKKVDMWLMEDFCKLNVYNKLVQALNNVIEL